MRMIDKAGGELGKTIAHPLQAKVDMLLERHLGEKWKWRDGYSIQLSKLSGINNKSYVAKRMSEHGLTLDIQKGCYVYRCGPSNSEVELVASSIEVEAIEPGYQLIELKPDGEIGIANIKRLILDGYVVSNKYLSRAGRKRLGSVMQTLKNHHEIAAQSLQLKSTSTWYSVYCIDGATMNEFAEHNYADLGGINAVIGRLKRLGEVRLKDLGMSTNQLTTYISMLRADGWVIRTLPKKKYGRAYRLISRP